MTAQWPRALALAVVASLFGASSALAAPHNWHGFYIGAVLGYEHQDGDIAIGPPPSVNFGAVSFNGASLGAVAGFNFVSGGGFVLGLEADIKSHFDQQENNAIVGAISAGYESSYTASARARAGFLVEDTLLYVTAGWGWTDIDVKPAPIFGPLGIADDTVGGFIIGGGFETYISDHLSVAVQYTHTEYDDTDALTPSLFGVSALKDPSSDAVDISLRWHWGD